MIPLEKGKLKISIPQFGKADNALNLQYYCFKLDNYLISPS